MNVLDSFRLDGKVAIVTGASSGLGVGFAQALAEAGADVALAARREDRLVDTQALVEAAGRRALAVRTDVSIPEDCDRLVAETLAAFGKVDILVNNAGVGTARPAVRETPDEFRSVIDVNLNGCYWMAQACGRVMEPGSSIVNISSVLGLTTLGLPQAAYSASKAGLIGLTRDLAQQWTGRKGIRVNALAPGFFASEMTDTYPEGYLETQLKRVVLGRPGEPHELAAALVFLVSDAGAYITGVTLPVDGGLLTTQTRSQVAFQRRIGSAQRAIEGALYAAIGEVFGRFEQRPAGVLEAFGGLLITERSQLVPVGAADLVELLVGELDDMVGVDADPGLRGVVAG